MNRMTLAILGALAIGMSSQAMGADGEPNGIPRRFYGYACIGSYDGPDQVGGLTNGSSGMTLAAGVGRRFNRYLAGEGEALVTGQTYRAPGYTGEGEPTVGFISLAYSLRASLPRGSFRPFVTAGVGFFQADVRLVEESSGWGYSAEEIERDRGLETHYGFGIDVIAGKRSWLGVEFRRINADAEFGDVDADLSGTSVMFAWRRDFGEVLDGR